MTDLAQEVQELCDRVEALERTVSKLYDVNVQFRDHMAWFRNETDKLMQAAGPLLQLAGPLVGGMLSDPGALLESLGAGQPVPGQLVIGETGE